MANITINNINSEIDGNNIPLSTASYFVVCDANGVTSKMTTAVLTDYLRETLGISNLTQSIQDLSDRIDQLHPVTEP